MDSTKIKNDISQTLRSCGTLVIGGNDDIALLVEHLKKFESNGLIWIGNSTECDINFNKLEQLLDISYSLQYLNDFDVSSKLRTEFYFALDRESQNGIRLHHAEFELNAHLAVVRHILQNSKIKKIIFSNVPHLRWPIAFYANCLNKNIDVISLLPTNINEIKGISELNHCTEYRNLTDVPVKLIEHSVIEHQKLKDVISNKSYYYLPEISLISELKKSIKRTLIKVLPTFILVLISRVIWKKENEFKIRPEISKDFSNGNRHQYSRTLFFKNLKTKIHNLHYIRKRLEVAKKHQQHCISKFVYFPLHYQPEATTMPMCANYVDQISFAQNLATRMQALGIQLVVKEHISTFNPRLNGDRSRFTAFYKELIFHPNIQFSRENIKDSDLLLSAIAVVSLTGTAAIEKAEKNGLGILMGSHYALNNYPTLHRANDITDVEDLVKEYLTKEKIPVNISGCVNKKFVFNLKDNVILSDVCNLLIG